MICYDLLLKDAIRIKRFIITNCFIQQTEHSGSCVTLDGTFPGEGFQQPLRSCLRRGIASFIMNWLNSFWCFRGQICRESMDFGSG